MSRAGFSASVRRDPYTAYILHLAAADSLSLGGTALVLVEEIFKLGAQLTLQAATILHPVSRCCDTVGLCLLAALGVLAPAWSRRRRPRGTSAVVSGLSWALGLSARGGRAL